MKNYKIIFILGFTFIFLGLKAQNTFKVVVNPSNSITSISKTELLNIFLKKTTKFSNGINAIPLDQSENSQVRIDFSNSVLKKKVAAVKSYWNQQLFSGAGVPPIEQKTDADVINFVKSLEGAIGYVSSSTSTSGVTVLTITE